VDAIQNKVRILLLIDCAKVQEIGNYRRKRTSFLPSDVGDILPLVDLMKLPRSFHRNTVEAYLCKRWLKIDGARSKLRLRVIHSCHHPDDNTPIFLLIVHNESIPLQLA
jgi:hypothetical protein